MENMSEQLMAAVKAALKVHHEEVVTLIRKTQEDIEKHGKIQEGTKDGVAELTKKGQELHARLFELEQTVVALKAAGIGRTADERKDLGDLFIKSKQWTDFAGRGTSVKGASEPFKVKAITGLTGGGGTAGIWSDRLPGVVEEPLRPLSIRDLLPVGRTSSNLIEWVRENVFTNNADVVSESTQKPESNITYERKNTPVSTIAHFIMATRQVLADFPMLASLINGRLRIGLGIAEENEILLGDGTGEHLLGLIPQATDYNTALNKSGDTMIDTIRHAILQVTLSFYSASGIVMSPTDWHNLELTKDNENRYMMASPSSRTPPMLWGLPVVGSHAMVQGGFLVGAFALAATLWDREDASVAVSTEDRDNFIKNMVTILCEERIALTVERPLAFVYGNFPIGSTT